MLFLLRRFNVAFPYRDVEISFTLQTYITKLALGVKEMLELVNILLKVGRYPYLSRWPPSYLRQ